MAEEYDFSGESFKNFDFSKDEKKTEAAEDYIIQLDRDYPRPADMSEFEKEQIANYKKGHLLYEKERERKEEVEKYRQQGEDIAKINKERETDREELTEEEKEERRKELTGGKKRKTKKNRKTKRRKTKRKSRKTRKYRKH